MSSLRLVPCLAVMLTVACGSGDPPSNFGDPQGDGSSGSSDAGSNSGDFGSSGGSSGDASSGDPTCASTVATPTKAKVDIIFVIDNSGSMGNEMNQIKTNVNAFASKIGGVGLDYTVTFIVRKGKSGNTICVPAPLAKPDCADNPPTFFHVDQSVGSRNSLSLILSTYDTWKAHLRLDATKVFVEVTDDKSNLPYTEFDTQLLAKAPAGMFGTASARKYIFHSVISKPVGEPPPSTKVCSTAANTSVDYQQLSLLTGGLMDEVCKTDYSGVLDNMAKGIVDKLGCVLGYPTAEAADPTKLAVQLTLAGQPAQTLTQVTDASKCGTIPNAWYYDDPSKPTQIILCPSTCTAANSSPGSKIEALVGCKTDGPK